MFKKCSKPTEVTFPYKGYVLNYDSQLFNLKKTLKKSVKIPVGCIICNPLMQRDFLEKSA